MIPKSVGNADDPTHCSGFLLNGGRIIETEANMVSFRCTHSTWIPIWDYHLQFFRLRSSCQLLQWFSALLLPSELMVLTDLPGFQRHTGKRFGAIPISWAFFVNVERIWFFLTDDPPKCLSWSIKNIPLQDFLNFGSLLIFRNTSSLRVSFPTVGEHCNWSYSGSRTFDFYRRVGIWNWENMCKYLALQREHQNQGRRRWI